MMFLRALLVLMVGIVAGCASSAASPSGTIAPTAAPSTPAPSPATSTLPAATAAPSATIIVLPALDGCTLIDQPTLQQLTGLSGVLSRQTPPIPGDIECLWAQSGSPQYVELRVYRAAALPTTFGSAGQTCTLTPVTGIGTGATFGTCPPPSSLKVGLAAIDRNILVRLLVNAPTVSPGSDALVPIVRRILLQVTSG